MASRTFLKVVSGATIATTISVFGSSTIQAQASTAPKKPSIYDDKVIELFYLEDKPSRLESHIKEIRLEATDKVSQLKNFIQGYVNKIVTIEKNIEETILKTVPETDEFLPNALYVGIVTLSGSIVSRNRNVFLRLASPLAFGIASSYYFLPGTTKNVFEHLKVTYLNNKDKLSFSETSLTPETAQKSSSYSSPELNILASKDDSIPLEQTIKEVEAMYTTRGDPGVRPVLERKEASS